MPSRRPTRAALAGVAALAVTAPLAGCGVLGIGGSNADLQIYSARHYALEGAFKDFQDETGISIEFISGNDAELLQRIKAEGADGEADVFMTVDAGNLWNAAQQDVLKPLQSPALDKAVPADLRDSENRWFGLAMRARTTTYNPDKVKPADFDPKDTYAGLADPKWKGRLCMRDATSAYTQSLVASLIGLEGREKTLEIVKGWVANGVQIKSNDVELIKAIDAGTCDVGITNHYYVARELKKNPNLKVKLYWASQQGAGTHVNISGAGVVKTSDNAAQAQQLIEWLATKGQSAFVDGNHEYPVNPDVKPEPMIAKFGEFKRMPLSAEAYGSQNAEAVELLAEAGYK
ncbi:iron(III) transport system substrate-binding protein [Knoellia remsis]|uniref:Iron(III) transport system substrate-binding protein n=1 Tax=Knoellia remsis TaxID=407159 RepID=A0A2T0ULC0_9MICO|nr:extracellular solute-binding protein [Knoellia remsis]PRY58729.1 iron(III) transport system substrate-binding protein [Knoellia remsis]